MLAIKKAGVLLAALVAGYMGKAQQVLKLKEPLIYYTAPASIALTGAGYGVIQTVKPFTASQLLLLNPASLNYIDRKTIVNNSHPAANWSNAIAAASVAMPVTVSLLPRVRNDFFTYNIVYAQCMLTTLGEASLLKGLIHKTRPYTYNPLIAEDKRLEQKGRLSFPSLHTAFSAAACFFAAKTFCMYYPDSKLKLPVWISAVAIPILTGYLRNRAGAHFYSDIAVGYAIGAMNGILFPYLFSVKKNF